VTSLNRKEIEELVAARKAKQQKPGVPQDDPADVAIDLPIEEPSVEVTVPREPLQPTPNSRPTRVAKKPVAPPPIKVEAQQPIPYSTYIHPERKHQLKLEALTTGKDMWEIIDEALAAHLGPQAPTGAGHGELD
jgi:hypothetical protein